MAALLSLLLSYSLCIIVVGHGALPLGVILLTGGTQAWFAAGKLMGWAAIICLSGAPLLLRSKPKQQRALQLGSTLLLYVSWLDIARHAEYESGSFLSTFVFSLPFQIIFLVTVTRHVVALRRGTLFLNSATDDPNQHR